MSNPELGKTSLVMNTTSPIKNNTTSVMDNSSESATQIFIAVHAGAGNHAMSNDQLYKAVCKRACQQGLAILRCRKSALEAVTAAVMVLEDDECTNAGRGSNLTIQGTVECDAGAMDGKSLLFGGVGALSGVANPVLVARRLVEEQKLGPLPLGRVRPSILVGKGAQSFCRDNNLEVKANLISASTLKTFIRYKRKYQLAESSLAKRTKLDSAKLGHNQILEQAQQDNLIDRPSSPIKTEEWCPPEAGVQDTVGAVCVDWQGNLAAACSSGGIWLKQTGRLGPACLFGTGCWAQNQTSEDTLGVAAVTSGCGEDLIQTLLAKTCSDAVRSTHDLTHALTSTFKSNFLNSEFLASKKEKFGGVLILRSSRSAASQEVELSWIHSTASLCLAYMAGSSKSPTTVMSRLGESCNPGKVLTMGGCVLRL